MKKQKQKKQKLSPEKWVEIMDQLKDKAKTDFKLPVRSDLK